MIKRLVRIGLLIKHDPNTTLCTIQNVAKKNIHATKIEERLEICIIQRKVSIS